MSLYAPFDGTVVEKQGEEGEVITPVGHELLAGPHGGRDDRGPRARWTSRPTSPRTCSRGSPSASRPRSPSAPSRPSTTGAGCGRSSRWATGPAARSRSRSRSSTPTTSSSPSWPRPSTSSPARPCNSPDAGRSFLFVPKAALFEENGHDYVWVVDAKNDGPQAEGRGRDDQRRPGPRRVGPRRPASRSSSTRSRRSHDERGRPDRRVTAPAGCSRPERLILDGRSCTSIVLRSVDKEYRRDEFRIPVLVEPRPDRRRGRVPRADGPLGLGQDDAAEPDRRARPGDHGARSSSTARTSAS